MIFRLALQELRYGWKRLRWVIFILFIGFVGPFLVSAFRSSVTSYLEASSRKMLSADLSVSSNEPLKDDQREWLKKNLSPSKMTEETTFMTMAKGRDVATLVEVEGVDENFPVYGKFRLQGSDAAASAAVLNQSAVAWVFPEVLAQLGLKVGDSLHLGAADFKISAVLDESPGLGRTGGFAPRVFLGSRFVEKTKLTSFGSQIFYRLFLRLPDTTAPDEASERIEIGLSEPGLSVRTPDDAIQGFERFFHFFDLYLVAVTMIVFVLSWTGAFYGLQLFLQDRLRNAAVLLVNGATRVRVGFLYGCQTFFVMMTAFVAAGLFVGLALVIAQPLLAAKWPAGFALTLPASDIAQLFGIAALASVAFNVPFLVRLRHLRVISLLRESAMAKDELGAGVIALTYVPLAALFYLVSVQLTGTWMEAARIAGGMALAAVIGLAVGRVLFSFLYRRVQQRGGAWRLITLQLARSRFGVRLCFTALVLASLALNLVPHLLGSVLAQIEPLEGREIPSLFLFNIPESELDQVQTFAQKRDVELRFISPLVLGRLTKVNGLEPESDQLQRFPVRLSYRKERIPSESLVAGREFSPTAKADDAEISVEQKFAERHKMKLGDTLDFDIQGVPVRAHIVNLRRVQWTTFNPNFFIMFQPGILDDAPKTYIANANFTDTGEKKVRLQYELTRDFPAVSTIDIGRTVTKILDVARSVTLPVETAAGISVLMSFLVLIGVVAHNLRLREGELEIEKILGADASFIRRLIVSEYAVNSGLAWLVGAASAAGIAFAVAHFALEVPLKLSFAAMGLSGFVVIGFTSGIASLFATKLLNERAPRRRL